jgi:hypothetical protein
MPTVGTSDDAAKSPKQGKNVKKLTLTDWAAAGEIVGTIAVVISLLFVGYSINRNTEAIQASSENILFERHTDLANHFMTNPSLAEIMFIQRTGDGDLSESDLIRWEKYELNMLDLWALAHSRYARQLLSADQWLTWDRYFTHMFSNEAVAISKSRWEELQYGFDTDFWEHVGVVLFSDVPDGQ